MGGDRTESADRTDRTDLKKAKTANARAARLEELVEEALRTANSDDDSDIERWITAGGKHIPIRKGQSEEEAIHEHEHFEKHATRGEKNRRQNHGRKWHLEQKKKAAKNETKGSQKAGENDKLNHEHDREKSPDSQGDNRASESRPGDSGSSKTDRSGRGESARSGGMSEAEAAHFSALVKQESSAGNNREKQIASAREYLEKSRKSGKIKTTVHDPARHLAQGSEHKVELSEDKRSVIKHTSDGYFGMIPDVSPRGTVFLRSATASEYMTRMQAQNAAFDTDFKFIGSPATREEKQELALLLWAWVPGSIPGVQMSRLVG